MPYVVHFETKTDVAGTRFVLVDATDPDGHFTITSNESAGFPDWVPENFAVDYVPGSIPELHLSIAKWSGAGTLFLRRVWIAESVAPLDPLNYGGWPRGSRYSALEQDGPGGPLDYMAFDTVAVGGGSGAFQYDASVGGFVDSETSCDWYFLPPEARGWKVGSLGPAR